VRRVRTVTAVTDGTDEGRLLFNGDGVGSCDMESEKLIVEVVGSPCSAPSLLGAVSRKGQVCFPTIPTPTNVTNSSVRCDYVSRP
jgi:hypothetical protein